MDLMSGIVVLSIMVLIFALSWNDLVARWHASQNYREMETAALFASEALMGTSGEPRGWESLPVMNSSGLTSFGLVSGRNELNKLKVEHLVAANATSYDVVRERLGVQRYQLGIRFLDLNRTQVFYEFGNFAGAMNPSVVVERIGILENKPVLVRMEVWQ